MSIYKDDAKERPTAEVVAIGQLNFEGNVIPHTWREHLRREDKRADTGTVVDLEATIVLAEIVYWYRPAQVIDEKTNTVLGWKKRFHGDKLQLSYKNIGEKTGLTKLQAKEAMDRLVSRGLVSREFRHIGNASNVLYIGVDVDRIRVISFPKVVTATTIPNNYETPSLVTTGDDPQYLLDTYTETTTEITTKTTASPAPSSGRRGRSVPKTGYCDEDIERVAVGDENGNEKQDAAPTHPLEHLICQSTHSRYLSVAQKRKLREPVHVVPPGKHAVVAMGSPIEEYNDDPEGFADYVRRLSTKVGGGRPSRTGLINAVRNYDRPGTGWMHIKAASGEYKPRAPEENLL